MEKRNINKRDVIYLQSLAQRSNRFKKMKYYYVGLKFYQSCFTEGPPREKHKN